ncbi:MAG: hypothetical protein ABWY80_01865 [Acidimicrobiia bacterium]
MKEGQGLGRNTVRLLAVVGVALLALSAVGWWLSSRVLDANGFADVVATSSQRREVRDYVADQATLRLAKTSNFVSAARPAVTSAISEAITAQPVHDAVYDFALLAHDQVFRISQSKRVNVSSAQAAITVRAALEAASPALAKKLPPNVLSATTTISQSETVDALFNASDAVNLLYLPLLVLGIGLLGFTIHRARDHVHAIRAIGVSIAVGGALIMGVGLAVPIFAVVAATNDPGRGDAVAAFIDVLVGRLYGAGKAMLVIGLLLALAPGHDGGDLRHRVDRVREWFTAKRASRRWRFAGGLALAALAGLALTNLVMLLSWTGVALALVVLYVGIVVCLRASGALVTDHSLKRLHKREVALVLVALIAGFVVTGGGAAALLSASTHEPGANPTNQGCNGYIELCAQTLDTIVWPGSHNAMSSSAYDFYGAEHAITVPEQLNAGARFLMLDAYYGYDDNGLVRTNLAGGLSRKELEEQRGPSAVRQLDRLGALTGTADTSGNKKDVYFCHDYCELGAVPAADVLRGIHDFLQRNLTDVVVIDIEDYVKPKDFRQALADADLLDMVYRPKHKADPWPSLHSMVVTETKNQKGEVISSEANPRRLVVMFEKQKATYPWLFNTYKVSEETPYNFKNADAFNCEPNRGGTGKGLLIVNHWINPGGLPDPVVAKKTNSATALTKRFDECITERQKIPNVFAVNFTSSGDLFETVTRMNAAIARRQGVTDAIDDAVQRATESGRLSRADQRDIEALKRLPNISEAKARKLLGALADSVPPARGLREFVTSESHEHGLTDEENDPAPTTKRAD